MPRENGAVEFILAWTNARDTTRWQSDCAEREFKISRYGRSFKVDVGQDPNVASWCSTVVDNVGTKLKSNMTPDTLSESHPRFDRNIGSQFSL